MKRNKHAFSRGFTLIELMIVIVILGILMGTILPRLTGAQARARDTARKADLTNIAQALEAYYSDNGTYPDMPTGGCLNSSTNSSDTTISSLGTYLKGGKVPMAVSAKQDTLGCTGSYYYKPLKSKGGVTAGSYLLASDVETWQLANFDATSGVTSGDATTYKVGTDQVKAETTDPKHSIYVIIP